MTMVMTVVTRLRNRTVPREQLRHRIYEAAIEVFRERGFDGAAIEEITARAGVAKGTFFNFYPAKADVLADYYRAVDAPIIALREAMDPSAPETALAGFAAKVEEVLRAEGPLLLDLLRAALSNAHLREIDYASGDADEARFATYLEKARGIGALDPGIDPARSAGVILDIWSGAMRRWIQARGEVSLAAMFAKKLHVVFKGLSGRKGHAPT